MNTIPEEPIKISSKDIASLARTASKRFIHTLSGFKKMRLIAIEGHKI